MTISEQPRFSLGGLAPVVLLIAMAAAPAMTGCSDQGRTTGRSSDARLVKVVGRYNIVRFKGNIYGAPHGVAIDWQKDALKNVPGMIVGTSVDLVEQSVRSLPLQEAASDARLIRVLGHYNIVTFKGNVYGAPHGVAIDWQKDDLKKVPGMINGSSVVLVEISVIGRLISETMPWAQDVSRVWWKKKNGVTSC